MVFQGISAGCGSGLEEVVVVGRLLLLVVEDVGLDSALRVEDFLDEDFFTG